MAARKAAAKRATKKVQAHEHFHADGSLWAKGQLLDGVMVGQWEWFRKDGSLMRAGSFENGDQVGTWTTYAADGRVVKVTEMKRKVARKA